MLGAYGNNNLIVNATPTGGGSISNAGSVVVRRATNMLYDPWDADLDIANNRLLVVDKFVNALFAIDLSTGVRTEISGTIGSGTALRGPGSLVLDLANNRAFVIDFFSVKSIDLSTGDRAIVSDVNNGTGPMFGGNFRRIALDSGGNRLLFVEAGQYARAYALKSA